MPPARMAEYWNTLPLEDRIIAAWLGVENQQVINLRKVARGILGRAWHRWLDGNKRPSRESSPRSDIHLENDLFPEPVSAPESHPADAVLADYLARRLPPSEVLAVSDHLAGCAHCRKTLACLRPAEAVGAADFLPDPGAADGVPDYEEMAALLDGMLSAEQVDEVHARLAASPGTAAEFADLRAFRDETATRPAVVHGPVTSKVVAFPGWVRFALAAAVVVLLNVAWWHFTAKPGGGTASLLAGVDLAALPADLRRSVEQAARTGTVDSAALPPGLRTPAGTLAGDASAPGGLKQVSPVGVRVRETRPRLRWQGRADATGYVVYLRETNDAEGLIRQELPANRADWPPPGPLTRGAVYEWQVEARRGDEVIERAPRPPAPEAFFQVLDAAQAMALDYAERAAHGNALVLGTAYARAGLRDEAAAQFRELAHTHPKSGVAERLAKASAQP